MKVMNRSAGKATAAVSAFGIGIASLVAIGMATASAESGASNPGSTASASAAVTSTGTPSAPATSDPTPSAPGNQLPAPGAGAKPQLEQEPPVKENSSDPSAYSVDLTPEMVLPAKGGAPLPYDKKPIRSGDKVQYKLTVNVTHPKSALFTPVDFGGSVDGGKLTDWSGGLKKTTDTTFRLNAFLGEGVTEYTFTVEAGNVDRVETSIFAQDVSWAKKDTVRVINSKRGYDLGTKISQVNGKPVDPGHVSVRKGDIVTFDVSVAKRDPGDVHAHLEYTLKNAELEPFNGQGALSASASEGGVNAEVTLTDLKPAVTESFNAKVTADPKADGVIVSNTLKPLNDQVEDAEGFCEVIGSCKAEAELANFTAEISVKNETTHEDHATFASVGDTLNYTINLHSLVPTEDISASFKNPLDKVLGSRDDLLEINAPKDYPIDIKAIKDNIHWTGRIGKNGNITINYLVTAQEGNRANPVIPGPFGTCSEKGSCLSSIIVKKNDEPTPNPNADADKSADKDKNGDATASKGKDGAVDGGAKGAKGSANGSTGGGSNNGLADTGAGTAPWLMAGALALLAGAGTVIAVRRRGATTNN